MLAEWNKEFTFLSMCDDGQCGLRSLHELDSKKYWSGTAVAALNQHIHLRAAAFCFPAGHQPSF